MGLNEQQRTVRVDIGELVLDGFGRVDPERVSEAFQAELGRLVRERVCRSPRTADRHWTPWQGCPASRVALRAAPRPGAGARGAHGPVRRGEVTR
ncbi:hypothetical protein NKH18_40825 [Streptomyces sp. M10(2022)]